jgi:cation-transporting ATPase 13A2
MVADDEDVILDEDDVDLEAALFDRRQSAALSRKSSTHDAPPDEPLIQQRESFGDLPRHNSRISQQIYIAAEDLTIVVAGFTTGRVGYAIYLTACFSTFGIGWLILRWLPRWRVSLIGKAAPLAECDWVVVEVRISLRLIPLLVLTTAEPME